VPQTLKQFAQIHPKIKVFANELLMQFSIQTSDLSGTEEEKLARTIQIRNQTKEKVREFVTRHSSPVTCHTDKV
jgi:hypothetical protein